METALVFSKWGSPLHWHVPPDRSMGAIPDSKDLWQILWDSREFLGGVAHTHPWIGAASPSQTDVTTLAAIEAGLGQRLVWPIVTFSEIAYFKWMGPERLDYLGAFQRRFRIRREDIEQLRELSK